MKIQLVIVFASLLFARCQKVGPAPAEKKGATTTAATTKQIRHIVLFKFKPTSTADDVKKIEASFAGLPAQIPEIKSFEWGLNNSPENLNAEFTHCFNLTFSDEKGRETYLPHPAHKAFVELVGPHVDKVLVFDF